MLLVAGCLSVLVAGGLFLLGIYAMGHRFYHVNGNIHVSAPGPKGVELPAVACMFETTYAIHQATTVTAPEEESRTAFVVCRIPDDGVSIPFHVSFYSMMGRGLLVGSFLTSLGFTHPACSPDAILTLVSDEDGTLADICEGGEIPAKSEVAMMAPFDDDVGRPANAMRIDIHRAE